MADVVQSAAEPDPVASLRCPHGVDYAEPDRRVTTRPSGTQVCTACGATIEEARIVRVRP